ncbi:MAG TPA: VWA domain-containing protein [Terriglobales bacterium]|jgi:VWFA-related protein|nr:VWA domain-containing protein [Terriglobales bacterium]
MLKVFHFQRLAAVLAVVVVFSAASLFGQADAPPERSAPQGNDSSSAQDDQSEPVTTFKGGVDVVQLFFNVKDKRGALIPNLKKEDFLLSEDGKPQTVKYFAENSDLPLTLGILIDASGSQSNVLDMEKQVGGAFLSDIIREKDLAFVLSFDVNVDLLQDFTSSTRKLKDALNSARINTGGGGGTIGGLGGGPIPTSGTPRGTLLYDAIYLASHDELAQQVGRKAMIILTDGEDQGSRLRVQDAIEAAQKSDSIVYVLMIADRGFYGGGFYHGDSEMKKLSNQTGGRVIDVGNKFDKLREAFDQIAQELRSQYSVGYTPTNTNRDGSFRKIEVKAKDYKIQARAGYYARASQ